LAPQPGPLGKLISHGLIEEAGGQVEARACTALNLPPSVRLFVARGVTDMRKSFDTLAALVIEVIDEDPMSGHLFLLINRRRNRAKILWWDRSGYNLLAKRLERITHVLGMPNAAARHGRGDHRARNSHTPHIS
jgi:transposase